MYVYIDVETHAKSQKHWEDTGPLSVVEIDGVGFLCGDDIEGNYYYGYVGWTLPRLADVLVLHNGIRFDIPVLAKTFHGWNKYKVHDTMIMSKILFPDRSSHSLESWAETLGMRKLGLENLEQRCLQDLLITRALHKVLLDEAKRQGTPAGVFKLEHRVARIFAEQYTHGVHFDREKAAALVPAIDARREMIHQAAAKAVPSIIIPENKLKQPPKKQFKKDGTPSALILKYLEEHGLRLEDVTLPLTSAVSGTKPLDISSNKELKDYLVDQGWKPTIWNYTLKEGKKVRTSPKFYGEDKELCPNLAAMAEDLPLVKDISEYLSLGNRRHVLLSADGTGGWLQNTRVIEESRLCADADTLGTETARVAHRIVANIPRPTSFMGREMRELFCASPGMAMVGWDASQLEALMEAHYVYPYDGGQFAELLKVESIHERNMRILGLSKDLAKRFKYATSYGASAKRLASLFGWSEDKATEILNNYWDAYPALAKLKQKLELFAKTNGYIVGLDGRRILCKQPHTAIARLFQSAGAIVMKYAMVIADRNIKAAGLDAHGLIRYHDEEQWETLPEQAHQVGKIGARSVELAGKYLKLRVPLSASYSVGSNWAETH